MSEHGNLTNYTKRGCRCPDCTRVAARYSKAWRHHQSSGRPPLLVDAEPVRAHVAALQEAGMSFRAITLAAGYRSRNSLATALSRTKVRRATAARILAVTAETDTRDLRYVSAIGSARRLQALAVLGHPSRHLAAALGQKDHSTVLDIQTGRVWQVRALTASRISALYDRLWSTPGPSKETTRRALARGWVGPLAWNDDELDDGYAMPDDRRYEESGARSDEDWLADWTATLPEHGGDITLAAARLATSEPTLIRALQRCVDAGETVPLFTSQPSSAV